MLRGALGYLASTRGVPVLYYGVEQGFDGNCPWDRIAVKSYQAYNDVEHACLGSHHARYRQDMFITGPWRLRSVVPEIDALAHVGFDHKPRPAPGADPYLRTDHELFRHLRRLIAIRKSCRALRRGEIYFRAAHQAAGGLLAFSRVYKGHEMVVLINTGDVPILVSSLHMDALLQAGNDFAEYRNLLNGYEQGAVGDVGLGKGLHFWSVDPRTGAQEPFVLGGHAVAIFAAKSNITTYQPDLETHLCRY
jgi:glycosidase